MHPTHRAAQTLCAITLLLLSGACGSRSSSRPTADGLGAIPFPVDRAGAALTPELISGAGAELSSGGAAVRGTALVLDASGAAGPEWAQYRFSQTVQPASVRVLLEDTVSDAVYIGLANYALQRWEFSGAHAGLPTISTGSPDYRSPADNLWIVVICPAGSRATIGALSVIPENPDNLLPSADLQADVSSGPAPLTVNFAAGGSSDSDGNIVEYAWDWENDGLWDHYTDSTAAAHTFTAAGSYSVRLRVTDDQFARSGVASVDITVNPANVAPTAQLLVDALIADPGDPLALDASGSSDPDGSIVDYEWDIDGNGVFNEPGWEAGQRGVAAPAATFPPTPSYFSIAVRVTDDRGGQDSAALDMIAQGWLKLVVDASAALEATNRSGSQSSLALVGGKPALGYRANGTLRYAWSSVADGSSGWSSVEVDGISSPGQVSLAQINGQPALCYDGMDLLGSTEVRYAWSTAADGSSGWSNLLLGSNGGYDLTISLVEVAGFPTVAYIEDTMGKVVHARSSEPDGSSGWASGEQFAAISAISQLAFVQGYPALALSSGGLRFVRSSAADGSGSWSSVDADATASVGNFPSLALVNGRPAVSHCHFTDKDLRYSWSSAADGSSGWSSTLVDSAGSAGGQTALAEVDGYPVIVYYDVTNDVLRFARSSTVDGSSGWSNSVIDSGAGVFCSLALLSSGQPAVSYYDNTNSELKYAVLYD